VNYLFEIDNTMIEKLKNRAQEYKSASRYASLRGEETRSKQFDLMSKRASALHGLAQNNQYKQLPFFKRIVTKEPPRIGVNSNIDFKNQYHNATNELYPMRAYTKYHNDRVNLEKKRYEDQERNMKRYEELARGLPK